MQRLTAAKRGKISNKQTLLRAGNMQSVLKVANTYHQKLGTNQNIKQTCEVGQGTRGAGDKEAGGVREAGEDGAGTGIPKVAGSGRKGEKLRNIVQYFAIDKNAKRREPTNTGRELGVKGTGRERFKPPVPPPPPPPPTHTHTCAYSQWRVQEDARQLSQ